MDVPESYRGPLGQHSRTVAAYQNRLANDLNKSNPDPDMPPLYRDCVVAAANGLGFPARDHRKDKGFLGTSEQLK